MARAKATALGNIRIAEVRAFYVTPPQPGTAIFRDPAQIVGILHDELQPEREIQENLWALFLDARNKILAISHVYRGTVNEATVSTRDIIITGLGLNATAVIVAHNHPSGDPKPSENDHHYTIRLASALALVNLELLDHIILGPDRNHFYSMRSRGDI